MVTGSDDNRGPGAKPACGVCGAGLAVDQRYCVDCGTRRDPLPAAVAAQLPLALERRRGGTSAASAPFAASSAAATAEEGAAGSTETAGSNLLPSPRVAAAAVLCMLGLGVALGSATGQLAQSAGLSTIVLEASSPSPPPEAAPVASEPEPEPEPAPVVAEPSSTPSAPVQIEEPAPEPAPESTPPAEQPYVEEESTLPEVKHLFLIVLGENGYEETFGPTGTAPYLSKTLPEQGELLPNYYAVTKGDLANQIALISGQGPTLETAADCPTYTDIVPATVSATGQVEGAGCVYPAATATLPGQLVEANLKWRAYVEDIGNGAAEGKSATCRHPALGGPDDDQTAVPGDAYVTWRNPFVYFHSLIDGPECGEAVVGLESLTTDLTKKVSKQTPALSYIVPDVCHAGAEAPCEPGQLTGPAAAEEFLEAVIPEITSSAAYKENGMIAITSSQARQAGATADESSCCGGPVYPNLPPAVESEPATGPVKPTGGGGKVGLLLISPFVEPGSVNETVTYNHYSLLLTVEELFGLEKLGYAAEPALVPFDESVFNAGEEEESAVVKRTAAAR